MFHLPLLRTDCNKFSHLFSLALLIPAYGNWEQALSTALDQALLALEQLEGGE